MIRALLIHHLAHTIGIRWRYAQEPEYTQIIVQYRRTIALAQAGRSTIELKHIKLCPMPMPWCRRTDRPPHTQICTNTIPVHDCQVCLSVRLRHEPWHWHRTKFDVFQFNCASGNRFVHICVSGVRLHRYWHHRKFDVFQFNCASASLGQGNRAPILYYDLCVSRFLCVSPTYPDCVC
jgi:hypothetical protein